MRLTFCELSQSRRKLYELLIERLEILDHLFVLRELSLEFLWGFCEFGVAAFRAVKPSPKPCLPSGQVRPKPLVQNYHQNVDQFSRVFAKAKLMGRNGLCQTA